MRDRRKNDARLSLRLPSDSKRIIEAAAAELNQTVSEFAVSTLVRAAHGVIDQSSTTRLSARDRDIFVAMLDDVEAKPNEYLVAAAKRYKRQVK